MSNIFKLYPTHFSRGGEKFSRGCFAPLVTGLRPPQLCTKTPPNWHEKVINADKCSSLPVGTWTSFYSVLMVDRLHIVVWSQRSCPQ